MTADYYTGWDVGGARLKFARLDRRGALTRAGQCATPALRAQRYLAAFQVHDGDNAHLYTVAFLQKDSEV